ncbi:MAG: iron ABC transporter permease [Spirochaetales bacterium]|nr:iron ABC transporter permease [Spirochaetales bacterium]
MKISKSFSTNFAVRGALLLLGFFVFSFYIYPPLLLFFKGRGAFGLLLHSRGLSRSLLNSIGLSISVFIAASVIGGVLAVIAVRTNCRLRKLINRGALLSFAIPPYILALAWVQIFGRNGYFERIIHIVTGTDTWHSNPYSLRAAAIVMTLHLYPLMYMSLRNALDQLSPQLEQAALLAGASSLRVLSGITLPLIIPNLLSTGLLVFSRTMANFSVPALLCLPSGIKVVPTGIYSALSGLRIGEAAFMSMVLVLVSTVLYIAHAMMLRDQQRENHVRKGCSAVVKQGRAAVYFGVYLFFIVACILPLISMFISSLLLRWGLPLKAGYFTLNNYRELFGGSGDAARAFCNSLVYGGTASLLAAVVGGAAVLAANSRRSAAGRVIEAAASWPMAIPNTVLAVAAIFAWNRPPLKLYGTSWVIIVTYMVLFTPIIMKQVSGLVSSQDKRLTTAARTMGAGRLRAFFTISLPLSAPGFISGVVICLMISLREIPISLMLYSAGQETVGVLLFGMQSRSYGLEMTSALAVVLIGVILAGNKLLEVFSGGKM